MPFFFEGYNNEPANSGFVFEGYEEPKKKQEPTTVKGAATAYTSGFGGGAGGILPDLVRLLKPLSGASETASSLNKLADLTGVSTTHDLTQKLAAEEPKNALERILQHSGQFGGQEALIGTGLGGVAGPAGALTGGGLGALHGSASGALYGGLKELGVDDEWALGITALATVSPIAFQKLLPKLAAKYKPGTSFKEAAESVFPKSGEAGISNEITENLKTAGKEAKEKLLGPNISKKIPESISKEKIKSTTHAGEELETAVGTAYDDLTARTNKAYNKSRKLNKNIQSIHPELESDLLSSIEELEKIPDPSAPMKRFIESSKKVAKDLAERTPDGSVIGYKPISNQVLIDQIQEYNSIPNFDFPSDTKTGIFKTLINKLTAAVDATAAKFPEAIKAWQEAKNLYAEKSNLFSDPDVAKWTKLTEKNYSKDFRSSIDIDKIRKLRPVLEKTEEGKSILQKMKRELVRERLDKFSSISNRFEKEAISEELAELEAVLTKDEIQEIERLIEESRTLPAKALSIADRFYKYIKRPSSALHQVEKIK